MLLLRIKETKMNKDEIKARWVELAQNNTNTAVHHAQLCILRAMASKHEDKTAVAKHLLRKAFTPVTRTVKLANGRTPFDAIEQCFTSYRWGGTHKLILGVEAEKLLTEDELKEYHEIAKSLCREK